MKITEDRKTVIRSHAFQEAAFRIEANPVMFEILSSRIYTDVPFAIVRELSTNARDAHVEAGNGSKPFDVHLPTFFDAYFSIRDYGTGIAAEDIVDVYTVFGASTRRISNDFTGCLGLGSKTPFAYTDQFTVTVFQDGKKRVYSCLKNEENMPACISMGETDTDEPNGLMVQISIDHDDIDKFIDAAHRVYRFFDIRPNITGAELEFPVIDPIMEGEGYQLYVDRYGLPAQVNVIMGQICYAAAAKVEHNLAYDATLVIEVETGDVSIAASREELQYNDHTNKNLQRIVTEAVEDIKEQIDAQLNEADCELARAIQWEEFSHIMSLPSEKTRFPLHVSKETKKVDPDTLDVNGDPMEITIKEDAYSCIRAVLKRSGNALAFERYHQYLSPTSRRYSSGYIFVENDVDEIRSSHKRRLRHWMNSLTGRADVFVSTITDRDAYTKIFGEPTIKISELPDVPRSKRSRVGGVSPTYIKRLSSVNTGRLDTEWKHVEDDEFEDVTDCLAIPKYGHRVMWGGTEVRPEYIRGIASAMGVQVYGLTRSKYQKLKNSLGLGDFEAAAKKWIEEWIDAADDATLALLKDDNRISGWGGLDNNIIRILTDDLSDICHRILHREDPEAPGRIHKRLIEHFGIEVRDVPPIETDADLRREFYVRYPLLDSVRFYGEDDVKWEILRYIRMCEAEANAKANNSDNNKEID
jgi:hypothetical protein